MSEIYSQGQNLVTHLAEGGKADKFAQALEATTSADKGPVLEPATTGEVKNETSLISSTGTAAATTGCEKLNHPDKEPDYARYNTCIILAGQLQRRLEDGITKIEEAKTKATTLEDLTRIARWEAYWIGLLRQYEYYRSAATAALLGPNQIEIGRRSEGGRGEKDQSKREPRHLDRCQPLIDEEFTSPREG